MQAAIKLPGLSVFLRLAAVAMTIAAGGAVQSARAQAPKREAPKADAPKTEAPPVAIGGWRHEKGANDIHFFHCETASCVPGSKVSYRFYGPGSTMTFGQYRSEQELIVKALQQRAPPGASINLIAIEGDDTETLPRMYKSRRLTVAADGTQEHVHSGILMGEKGSVSLISSSRDEKAASAGFATYAIGLMLVIQRAPEPKK